GYPVANRNIAETASMVGNFVNIALLKVHVDINDTFVSLLDKVVDFTKNAVNYQSVPFDLLVDAFDIKRTARHHPLYQLTIGLQPNQKEFKLSNLVCDPIATRHTSSKHDLGLDITETDNGVIVRWEYSTDI